MKKSTIVTALGLVLSTAACDDGAAPRSTGPTQVVKAAVAQIRADAAFVEQHPDAMLAWDVAPDGNTKLVVRSGTCEPLTSGVTGTVQYLGISEGKTADSKLTFDKTRGVFTAQGMKLDKEATEIRYALDVKGKKIEGALHVPAGGTNSLLATADESRRLDETAAGPHGGTVVVIDKAQYEIAADETSGEVRVFPLTPTGEISNVKPESMRLLVGGPKSMVIDLVPRGGDVAVAKVDGEDDEAAAEEGSETKEAAADADATDGEAHFAGLAAKDALGDKLTLVVRDKGKVKMAVVGHRRGRALALGHANLKQRYWSRHGWKGAGLKLGHRLDGPPGRAKQLDGKDPKGKAEGHDEDPAKGKAKGHDEDPAEGKAKGHDKDPSEGKAKGHDKDPAEGKAKGQDQGKGQGQGQPAGKPAGPSKGKGSK